ncbi:SIS domain-containing protein [Oricola thermophila]|uniref:Glutamine--fructose-6-phosphate aminotransferase [isomerizing] n=1 Tax=Oricola thermophila TaxID=2742145 RepID=A0A6N1VJW6_9HYPH|nr:SIS domain-containing protein [Oricola thermophila]QKV19509.1 SIS domain-containing protein [Oricola thermophila]
MCGIAGFVTGAFDARQADTGWLAALSAEISAAPPGLAAVETLQAAVGTLEERFADLMSFDTGLAVAFDGEFRRKAVALADAFKAQVEALTELSRSGRTDLDPLIESLRDYEWQIREELVAQTGEAVALMPADMKSLDGNAAKVALATEHVLRANDRLEVRGRDSAGIAIQIQVPQTAIAALSAELKAEYEKRSAALHADHLAVYFHENGGATATLTFVFKTANLVGRLGDNGAALRETIRNDHLLWTLAGEARRAGVLSHTRWASHGIISVANCHPHNPSVKQDETGSSGIPLGAMYALNGDVDNHMELLAELVTNRQMAIDPAITTDAKIIPIAHRSAGAEGGDLLDRFRTAIRRLDGSIAVGCIDPGRPGEAFLAQKGSGQGLHAARLADGWMFASEVYGLCNVARASYNLARSVAGGSVIQLDGDSDTPVMRGVSDGTPATVNAEPIQIFARDIYRGHFDFYLEKEIHDGPESVAKTLRGRYRRDGGLVAFDNLPTDIWAQMRKAVAKGIARVYVIGQGTAGVAAVGIAHLIERALGQDTRLDIAVTARRSSEMSAEIDAYDFRNALVIAVSQSGTTTDTNRAVDLARERGATIHAIVNRRNSDLVRKADSVLFTSDGRDVEMSVASTKAFYSQLTAGKLTALFLADALNTMTDVEIAYEMGELERLPSLIAQVLENEDHIAECARSFAPQARYWAVTGSGVNHVAALEIRIKLSELCYKSIPVDYTEDKKHIDLSTEPLTLVIANDLPGDLVGDVVKEVAIFKAHNGRPIVFATEGDDAAAFAEYAERVIALPKIGGDLAFVLATVAGHMFGFHAARAIDRAAQLLKPILTDLGHVAMGDRAADRTAVLERLDAFIDEGAAGAFNSGLGANDLAMLAKLGRELGRAADADAARAVAEAAIGRVRHTFEETSRPIDTIRHQAKTVTVGTSRPEDALSPAIRDALAELGVADSRLSFDNRKVLAAVSRLIDTIEWTAQMSVEQAKDGPQVRLEGSAPSPAMEPYSEPAKPLGVLGSALDDNTVHAGYLGDAAVIAVPVNNAAYSEVDSLICFAVRLQAHASREQKAAAMTALGTYKPALREWEQVFGEDAASALARQIARETPENIVFRPKVLDPALSRDERQSA